MTTISRNVLRHYNWRCRCGVATRGLSSSYTTNQQDDLVKFESGKRLMQHGEEQKINRMSQLRMKRRGDIEALPEYVAQEKLVQFLNSKANREDTFSEVYPPTPPLQGYKHEMTADQIKLTLKAAMATFALHVQARIASLVGEGYYTIGPCGEELLSSIAHCIQKDNDSMALHYRHLGVNVAHQFLNGTTLPQVLLDRARGYVVSRNDPVTGGVHCAIGSAGQGSDHVVTSTLASQCPSAVGRALGYALNDRIRSQKSHPISFTTIGDGSVHNHHFWSSFHLARHARHLQIKCPIVFGISDNGLSISYPTRGYVDTLFDNDELIPLYRAHGGDMMSVYDQTRQATQYARQHSAPALVVYSNVVRRFGHAATDRQDAYLTLEEIQQMADTDVLASAMVQAVEVFAATSYNELRDLYLDITRKTEWAFDEAVLEPKVTRQEMMDRVSQPMVPVPRLPNEETVIDSITDTSTSGKRLVMRKLMTQVIAEVLEDHSDVVYIGEDVVHGGYYLVTDGLAKRFPGRVIDFPPDETTLLGATMGFAQVGLTPICEIPYAKYLDCGVDMFYEVAVTNWLTAGQRPNGIVIRLQGFDRGTFGGNFHTHNMLSHAPPGIDVVCYSNGRDYVRGFRNAIKQAKNGRVVMLVDCTHLLNLRHLHEKKDRAWECAYPEKNSKHAVMGFQDVIRYRVQGGGNNNNNKRAIVSYGNGVVTSLKARRALCNRGIIGDESELDIIDCPYISAVPDGLKEVVRDYEGIVFADICKEGPGSNIFSSMITSLHSEKLLPQKWEFVGAPRTYNPLGSVVTFLNDTNIEAAFEKLIKQGNNNR